MSSARSLRTLFLSPQQDSPNQAFMYLEGESTLIKLPRRNLSAEIELPNKPLSIAFLSSPLEEGEELPSGAPIVKIPAKWKRVYLLFLPDSNNTVFPAAVIPINASEEKFALGETVIFNLSDSYIKGKFGSRVLKIGPRKSKVLKAPLEESGSYRVQVACALASDSENWVPLVSSTWRYNANVRKLMFVVPHPRRKYPFFWSVDDHPQL